MIHHGMGEYFDLERDKNCKFCHALLKDLSLEEKKSHLTSCPQNRDRQAERFRNKRLWHPYGFHEMSKSLSSFVCLVYSHAYGLK
jgi:hypothetical protein